MQTACGCHLQAALTSFDDTSSKELEIEVVTQEVTRLFREAEKQLQRFGHQQSVSDADDKVGQACSHMLQQTVANLSGILLPGRASAFRHHML